MYAQYADESNSYESENDEDEQGSDEIEISDDEIQLCSQDPPSVPRPKLILKRSTPAAQNVPVSEVGSSGNKDAGASVKPVVTVPKKRPYVESVPESSFSRKIAPSEKRSSLTTKNPEEASRKLPSAGSQNKPKDAMEPLKKPLKTVTWATDAPPILKGRQNVKKHPQKAIPVDKPPLQKKHEGVNKQPKKRSALQSTKKVPSTSLASKKKDEVVKVLPVTDGPPTNRVSSKKEKTLKLFWADTLASDFDSSEYEKLLKKCNFNEDQAEVIKQSFHLLCRKLHLNTTYTDRLMKTHMCIDCQYSISHECVSVHFSQYVRSNASALSATTISPESMNMCICGFGFIHSHNNSRVKLTNNLSSMNILHLHEHDRCINLSCPNCHMKIVKRNRYANLCSNFTNLVDLEAYNRPFYDFLQDRLQLSSMKKPDINELFTCSRRCCWIFHRCSENTVTAHENKAPLIPTTTYTRTLVTRSID